jgi:DNA-binding transcriptional MerR regulator
LVRLQRVLLLRELGLGLSQIADVLDRQVDEQSALATHLRLLHHEQDRLARQIAAVEHTLMTLRGEDEPMAEKMFDGFDHTQYREEVEQRWGADAYARSDAWWRSLNGDQQLGWKAASEQLAQDWIALWSSGADPHGRQAQELAARHVAWLRGIPGTPAADPGGDYAAYVRGLAEMYVADERFAAYYGGVEGATFVRDALLHHVQS